MTLLVTKSVCDTFVFKSRLRMMLELKTHSPEKEYHRTVIRELVCSNDRNKTSIEFPHQTETPLAKKI